MNVGPRGYVTYFDQRYLPRALVMLRSLRRHDPEARVFPLCFDALAFDVVCSLADPKIAPIEAAALIAFEPRLPDCAERGRWAFYATHKPLLPLYVFAQHPELSALVHIDADTWFFAAPAPLYAELGDASVGLSPHRFSPTYEQAEVYGKFNAGFIYWRHDETALRCLEDYRADCLSWCYNRLEPDGRYMNQGYLTSWPDRYPNVHVLQHPGANLAYWNIARHQLAEKPSLTADGEPVVFYHFSNVHQDGNRVWRTPYAEYGPQYSLVLRALYHPYLSEIEKTERQLRRCQPGLLPIDPPPGLETMPALRFHLKSISLTDRPSGHAAQLNVLTDRLAESEADRAARLEQIDILTNALKESEADRAARLEQINILTNALKKSEADRAARLEQIDVLSNALKQSETDRSARLEQISILTDALKQSEADRAARLEVIEALNDRLTSPKPNMLREFTR